MNNNYNQPGSFGTGGMDNQVPNNFNGNTYNMPPQGQAGYPGYPQPGYTPPGVMPNPAPNINNTNQYNFQGNNNYNYNNTGDSNKSSNSKVTILIVIAVVLALLIGGIVIMFAISFLGTFSGVDKTRNTQYINTASSYVRSTTNLVAFGTFKKLEGNTLYLVPVGVDSAKSCILLESGGRSPFSDSYKTAYVGFVISNGEYTYYFVAIDNANTGIKFIDAQSLDGKNTNIVTKNLGNYASELQKVYSNGYSRETSVDGKKYLKEPDNDIIEMARKANVDNIKIFSINDCK